MLSIVLSIDTPAIMGGRVWSAPVDAVQHVSEQISSNGDLSHQQRDVATVMDDLPVNLNQSVSEYRTRSVLHDVV